MAATDQDWANLKADLEANFDITIPEKLDSILIGDTSAIDDISNLGQAKTVLIYMAGILVEITRVVSTLMMTNAFNREEQTQKNLITNRIYTAKQGYQDANPEFDPNTWDQYTNTEMFAMIQPYDPRTDDPENQWYSQPETIEATFVYVYSLLNSKVRDANDKIFNVHKKIIDVEPLF